MFKAWLKKLWARFRASKAFKIVIKVVIGLLLALVLVIVIRLL